MYRLYRFVNLYLYFYLFSRVYTSKHVDPQRVDEKLAGYSNIRFYSVQLAIHIILRNKTHASREALKQLTSHETVRFILTGID